MMSSKEKFNKVFNDMNNYEKEEKHLNVHEEKEKMNVNHEIHEGDYRPSNYDVRKKSHT